MPKHKIAVTIDGALLNRLDRLVSAGRVRNRSAGLEAALASALERTAGMTLARECAKLLPAEERRAIDEAFGTDLGAWPAY